MSRFCPPRIWEDRAFWRRSSSAPPLLARLANGTYRECLPGCRQHGGQFRSYPLFVTDGGLISYRPPIMGGPRIELWRRSGRASASIRTSIKHGLVGLVLIRKGDGLVLAWRQVDVA